MPVGVKGSAIPFMLPARSPFLSLALLPCGVSESMNGDERSQRDQEQARRVTHAPCYGHLAMVYGPSNW